MLEFLRRQSKPIMIALATVIIIAFVFWGGYTQPVEPGRVRAEDTVLTVAGRDYSYIEVSKLQQSFMVASQLQLPGIGIPGIFGRGGFASEVTALKFALGDAKTFMPLAFEDAPVDYGLNLLVLRKSMEKLGIRVTNAEAKELFRTLPVFNENGQFNPEYAREFLRFIGSRGYSEEDVYGVLRDVIGLQRLYQLVAGNIVANPTVVDRYYASAFSTVKAATIPFPLDDFKKKAEVTEKDIKDYYDQEKGKYLTEEKRAVTLISFPKPDTKGKDAEGTVKAEREFQEKVQQFSELVLKPGVNLEEEAKKTKIAEVKTLPAFAQDAPPAELKEEAELVTSIFRNDPKTLPISDPVTTSKGYAFFAVTTVEQPKQQELKDVEAKIREVLVSQKATVAMTKAANDARAKLEEAIKGGKKFEDAAKEAGLTPQMLAEFSVVNPPPDVAYGFKFGGAAQATAPGHFAKDVVETDNGVLLLFVISKELRKSEEAAAMKSRMASFQDQRARQDYFRAWFEKERENSSMKLETLQNLAMSESR